MKKIICTVTNDLTYDQRMIRICSTLAIDGYEVELAGRNKSSSIPLLEQPFRQKRLSPFFEKGKLFYFEYNVRMFFYLLFARYDAVCAIDLDTILPAYFTSFLKRKICVYDAHEYFTEVPEIAGRPFTKKVWELIGKYTIPRVHAAYTVNQSLADIFLEKYKLGFKVIRNLPELRQHDIKREEKPMSPFIIIYQGVLNVGRGLEEAIEAVKDMDDAELWLAGEGDISLKLRELVQKYSIKDKVRFLGQVPPEQLAALTKQAHLGLNLLKAESLNYYYSLANKALDYIQSGLPSVNMNFPEYVRLNKEFEVFHLINDLEHFTLVRAIELLRNDRLVYNKLKNNCQKAARELNWESEKKRLLEIYNSLPY